MSEQAVLLALADELRDAYETAHEAHSLRDWPSDGCFAGCIKCVEKWLRARLTARLP